MSESDFKQVICKRIPSVVIAVVTFRHIFEFLGYVLWNAPPPPSPVRWHKLDAVEQCTWLTCFLVNCFLEASMTCSEYAKLRIWCVL